MPPTIMFHGDADQTVPYAQAVALDKRLKDSGNTSKLVTIPGGAHGYTRKFPEWEDKGQDLVRAFLTEQGILK
jgi:dipeptidyl aminopeptidase/acylaminoacyl peptidase